MSDDPYRLAREVPGVGFKTADAMARKAGLPADSPARIRAGILHCLRERADDGDVCLPFHRLVREAQALLEVDRRMVAAAIERLGSEGEVAIEAPPAGRDQDRSVYLPELRAAEAGVAEALRELAGASVRAGGSRPPEARGSRPPEARGSPGAVDAEIAASASVLGISLAPGQTEGLRQALTRGLAVITGGPGTGKTTVLRTLLAATDRRGLRVLLAAPTGKAAARMSEATGKEAKTIHRMLELAPGTGFRRNRGNPLDCDMVVIDEASMVDTPLMHHLLRALPRIGDRPGAGGGRGPAGGPAGAGRGCALLLVGDADQLPSVGPGQVLRDIIASGIASVTHLTDAFRQAKESDIVVAAHRILQGLLPEERGSRGQGDFLFVEEPDPERAVRTVVDLVCGQIPRRLSVDPLEGIQVLAPMRKGVAGSAALNRALQASLNPQGTPLAPSDKLFGPAWQTLRVGDKVMQRRNNYQKGAFNGDVGRITGSGAPDDSVVVSFDGEQTLYSAEEVRQLSLAYALTVHKAQGSEYPAVVLALLDEHGAMLERTLLYTAVTRARRLAVIVGSRGALQASVRRAGSRSRCTGLVERLKAAQAPAPSGGSRRPVR